METAGSPKFPGTPRDHSPCSLTPARPGRLSGPRVSCLARPPHGTTTRAPHERRFRGSIAQRSIWLSTLRSGSYPPPRKTRFRLLAQLYRTGLVTRRVPAKGFTFMAILLFRASRRYVPFFHVIQQVNAFGTGCALPALDRSAASMPPPSRPEEITTAKEASSWPSAIPGVAGGALPSCLHSSSPAWWLAVGMSSKPAPVDAVQAKKAQK